MGDDDRRLSEERCSGADRHSGVRSKSDEEGRSVEERRSNKDRRSDLDWHKDHSAHISDDSAFVTGGPPSSRAPSRPVPIAIIATVRDEAGRA